MNALFCVLAVAAMLATVGHATAQMKGGKKGHSQESAQPKKKADDKGYKSALDRIPDQKFDPWGRVR